MATRTNDLKTSGQAATRESPDAVPGDDERSAVEVLLGEVDESSPKSDADWYFANFDRLVAQFPNHYLAIRGNKVIAAEESPILLRERLGTLPPGRQLIVRSHPLALESYK
jgi:hypothetical protein